MIRRREPRSGGRMWIVLYAVLCAIIVGVGWTSVILIDPGTDGPVPTGSGLSGAVATEWPSQQAATAPTLRPSDTPAASPTKALFYMDLYRPGSFVSQMNREYCMAGAVQNMLDIMDPTADTTTAKQTQIGNLLVSLTTKDDSRNGGFGPNGWALAMPKLGAGTYKLVVDPTRDQAMRDAALALAETGRPVGLLTWYGAHSWVMSGFKADSDPLLFPATFTIRGVYIVDPFFPRVSSIWGATLGPDTYRSMDDVAKNFLGWKRPEGHYPTRDGKFLIVIPVNS